MQWVVLVVGVIACAAFCWYVLREDRRAMRVHDRRRERLRLVVSDEPAPPGVTAADALEGEESIHRDAA